MSAHASALNEPLRPVVPKMITDETFLKDAVMRCIAPACLCAAVLTAATSAGASPVTLEFEGIVEFVQRVEDERS